MFKEIQNNNYENYEDDYRENYQENYQESEDLDSDDLDWMKMLEHEIDRSISEDVAKLEEKYNPAKTNQEKKTQEKQEKKEQLKRGRLKKEDGLSLLEILLLKEIMALTGSKNSPTNTNNVPICIKSKQSFAKEFKTTPQNINARLQKLEKYGFISRDKKRRTGKITVDTALIYYYLNGDKPDYAKKAKFEIKVSPLDLELLTIDKARLEEAKQKINDIRKKRLEEKENEIRSRYNK